MWIQTGSRHSKGAYLLALFALISLATAVVAAGEEYPLADIGHGFKIEAQMKNDEDIQFRVEVPYGHWMTVGLGSETMVKSDAFLLIKDDVDGHTVTDMFSETGDLPIADAQQDYFMDDFSVGWTTSTIY